MWAGDIAARLPYTARRPRVERLESGIRPTALSAVVPAVLIELAAIGAVGRIGSVLFVAKSHDRPADVVTVLRQVPGQRHDVEAVVSIQVR